MSAIQGEVKRCLLYPFRRLDLSQDMIIVHRDVPAVDRNHVEAEVALLLFEPIGPNAHAVGFDAGPVQSRPRPGSPIRRNVPSAAVL